MVFNDGEDDQDSENENETNENEFTKEDRKALRMRLSGVLNETDDSFEQAEDEGEVKNPNRKETARFETELAGHSEQILG